MNPFGIVVAALGVILGISNWYRTDERDERSRARMLVTDALKFSNDLPTLKKAQAVAIRYGWGSIAAEIMRKVNQIEGK